MNYYRIAFGHLVTVGFTGNMFIAFCLILIPQRFNMFLGFDDPPQEFLMRLMGFGLMLLSVLYIPGAFDLFRHRFSAGLTVFMRFAAIVLWGPAYLITKEPAILVFFIADFALAFSKAWTRSRAWKLKAEENAH